MHRSHRDAIRGDSFESPLIDLGNDESVECQESTSSNANNPAFTIWSASIPTFR
jgi:hypothetical protein